MDYLNRCGEYADTSRAPRPNLVLLDLNMPRKNGWEALRESKSSYDLRKIPVVILTTSQNKEDITLSYEFGVNSFITKPVTYDALLDLIRTLWIKTGLLYVKLLLLKEIRIYGRH